MRDKTTKIAEYQRKVRNIIPSKKKTNRDNIVSRRGVLLVFVTLLFATTPINLLCNDEHTSVYLLCKDQLVVCDEIPLVYVQTIHTLQKQNKVDRLDWVVNTELHDPDGANKLP